MSQTDLSPLQPPNPPHPLRQITSPHLHIIIIPLIKPPPKTLARVVEPQFLVQRRDGFDVGGVELEVAFEVALDPGRGFAFGEDGVLVGYTPGCGGFAGG